MKGLKAMMVWKIVLLRMRERRVLIKGTGDENDAGGGLTIEHAAVTPKEMA